MRLAGGGLDMLLRHGDIVAERLQLCGEVSIVPLLGARGRRGRRSGGWCRHGCHSDGCAAFRYRIRVASLPPAKTAVPSRESRESVRGSARPLALPLPLPLAVKLVSHRSVHLEL